MHGGENKKSFFYVHLILLARSTTLCIIELSNASHVFICKNLGVFNYSMNIHCSDNKKEPKLNKDGLNVCKIKLEVER